jgi:UDP-hydrolysing UDP-N-acetyl-D-glucosamine 2-epimerase
LTKRICFFSSSRADFGIQRKLISASQSDPDIDSLFVISGGHTDSRLGETRKEIDEAGINVTLAIEFKLENDSAIERLKACNNMALKLAEFLSDRRPDVFVLLGDRFEVHAAAQAAVFCGVPIAHIHGGELSQGSLDELFRHSISKLSNLHLPSSEAHARRLLNLGEEPRSVMNIGSLAIEQLLEFVFFDRKEIQNLIEVDWRIPQVLVTYHPVSLDLEVTKDEISKLGDGLLGLSKDAQIHLCLPNSDNGFYIVEKELERLAVSGTKVQFYKSMGQKLYFSCLKHMDLLVGNSSSGLIEAPILGMPVIDYGMRQSARESPKEVVRINADGLTVEKVCRELLRAKSRKVNLGTNPFYQPKSSEQALAFLKANIPRGVRKSFYER